MMPLALAVAAIFGVAYAVRRSNKPGAFCLVDPDTGHQVCFPRPLTRKQADHLTYVASNPKVPQAVADQAKAVLIADGFNADAQAITDLEHNTSVPIQ